MYNKHNYFLIRLIKWPKWQHYQWLHYTAVATTVYCSILLNKFSVHPPTLLQYRSVFGQSFSESVGRISVKLSDVLSSVVPVKLSESFHPSSVESALREIGIFLPLAFILWPTQDVFFFKEQCSVSVIAKKCRNWLEIRERKSIGS